ncbi:PP2C family protein-serine/threonine phosphatase [Meridianimarinicoccus aquatilis]|uniref:PP2C family protein-serine/threonine phosphatase n=1 Tax=Meridianimarinicoccus aquatilis TaxID=2552766 RepID=UPI001FB5E296|nr:SpoIIE family protein phosphatase [Fluviibacterium aquatile]
MLIVVADDDASQRIFTSTVLKRLGHTPLEAEDGDVALKLIQDSKAPILVCDLKMPGLDGHQLTQQVRALDLGYYVHIVMVTGRDQGADRRLALEAGVDDFMQKPLDAAVLTVRIKAAARLVQHEEALSERNRILNEAKERIEADLHAAADAQRRLLPDPRIEIQGCRFTSSFVPSTYVSGDMYGCFDLNHEAVGIYAVDVAGHGVHAALLSVAIGHLVSADFFANYALTPSGEHDPAALVRELNARFYSDEGSDYFTMFCGVLDQRTGTLTYCQAGAPSPFMIASDQGVTAIGDGGFPVALLPDLEYENGTVQFEPGATLVVYSDGATEAENADGTPFGEDRLMQLIAGVAKDDVAQVPKVVTEALTKWRSGDPLEDDLTVFTLERSSSK